MRLLWLALLAACDGADGPSVTVDAAVDTTAPVGDAGECLALEAARIEGSTSLGEHDIPLVYVGAGDCITISQLTLSFRQLSGETMSLQFAYPVMSGANGKRFVPAGAFDRTARIMLGTEMTTTSVHVDVVEWQEGDGVHEIDATITFPDDAIAPVHVKGTFCDWDYLLC